MEITSTTIPPVCIRSVEKSMIGFARFWESIRPRLSSEGLAEQRRADPAGSGGCWGLDRRFGDVGVIRVLTGGEARRVLVQIDI